MGYKKAMVFFIDILGTKDRCTFEDLYKINSIFHNELERNKVNDYNHSYVAYERTIHTFSDCAYIIYDFKDGISEEKNDIVKLFKVALCNTEPIILEFLKNNLLCRGGVTYGDVYYEKDRSLLFGPAVNTAYLLESEEAKYPRIIVDDFIAQKVINYDNDLFQKVLISNKAIYEIKARDLIEQDSQLKLAIASYYLSLQDVIEKLIKIDIGEIVKEDKVDGKYFLNYFNSISQGVNQFENEDLIKSLQLLIIEEKSKQLEKIDSCNDDNKKMLLRNIIKKYEWLENYLDESQFKEK